MFSQFNDRISSLEDMVATLNEKNSRISSLEDTVQHLLNQNERFLTLLEKKNNEIVQTNADFLSDYVLINVSARRETEGVPIFIKKDTDSDGFMNFLYRNGRREIYINKLKDFPNIKSLSIDLFVPNRMFALVFDSENKHIGNTPVMDPGGVLNFGGDGCKTKVLQAFKSIGVTLLMNGKPIV